MGRYLPLPEAECDEEHATDGLPGDRGGVLSAIGCLREEGVRTEEKDKAKAQENQAEGICERRGPSKLFECTDLLFFGAPDPSLECQGRRSRCNKALLAGLVGCSVQCCNNGSHAADEEDGHGAETPTPGVKRNRLGNVASKEDEWDLNNCNYSQCQTTILERDDLGQDDSLKERDAGIADCEEDLSCCDGRDVS